MGGEITMAKTVVLWFVCTLLCACGGGSNKAGGTVPAPTLSGTLTFPSSVAKVASKEVAASTETVTLQLLDLNGNLIATASVSSGTTSDTYTYTTTATISKDVILKAVRGSQILRAALDSSTYTLGAIRDVNVITTTAVVVIEQNLGITAGALGTPAGPGSPPALKTQFPATVEIKISQAITAASAPDATNFTTISAAYANLAAIITAAIINNIDPAQFISGTSSATITTPVTIYRVSSSGTPVANSLEPGQIASSVAAIISVIKSSGSDTTYSISGIITLNGAEFSGVTVTLSGGNTATTDSTGSYVITGVSNGSYTITPSFSGYVFNPANAVVTVNGANVTGKNFSSANTGSILIGW